MRSGEVCAFPQCPHVTKNKKIIFEKYTPGGYGNKKGKGGVFREYLMPTLWILE
jgi:hypothetical protein